MMKSSTSRVGDVCRYMSTPIPVSCLRRMNEKEM